VFRIFVHRVVIIRDDGGNEKATQELGNCKVDESNSVVGEEIELSEYPEPVSKKKVSENRELDRVWGMILSW
jgi:hypothetical protein